MLSESDVVDLLKTNRIVTVEFQKKDGSLRTMQASWAPEYTNGPIPDPVNGTFRVVDTQKNAWRSFTMASLRRITV
jgi:hypothetical protein